MQHTNQGMVPKEISVSKQRTLNLAVVGEWCTADELATKNYFWSLIPFSSILIQISSFLTIHIERLTSPRLSSIFFSNSRGIDIETGTLFRYVCVTTSKLKYTQ